MFDIRAITVQYHINTVAMDGSTGQWNQWTQMAVGLHDDCVRSEAISRPLHSQKHNDVTHCHRNNNSSLTKKRCKGAVLVNHTTAHFFLALCWKWQMSPFLTW